MNSTGKKKKSLLYPAIGYWAVYTAVVFLGLFGFVTYNGYSREGLSEPSTFAWLLLAVFRCLYFSAIVGAFLSAFGWLVFTILHKRYRVMYLGDEDSAFIVDADSPGIAAQALFRRDRRNQSIIVSRGLLGEEVFRPEQLAEGFEGLSDLEFSRLNPSLRMGSPYAQDLAIGRIVRDLFLLKLAIAVLVTILMAMA